MLKTICNSIYHNKNILMLLTVCIYIFAVSSVLIDKSILVALIFTIFIFFFVIKNIFPIKIIVIWTVIFYLGLFNTNYRLKPADELLSITPINSTVYGKIISVPQTKNGKTKFFFNVSKADYDNLTKNFNNEKILVSLNSEEKLKIYDSFKIRGRLSHPFKVGNPSQFDYSNYLKNYSTYAVFYGHNPYEMRDLDIPCYEKINNKKNRVEKILQKISDYRENIISVHSNYLKSPNLEILGGIVFGDDAVSPPDNIKQSFINSGLLHILAASGMNVAFIFSFFFFFLRLIKINYRINILICILAVITYVLMTGLGASVVRASLMLIFVLIGKLIDRDAHSISLLSCVAFLMLLYNPMLINDVGFQLSFIVTFGLLMTTPYIIKSKYKVINWIIGTIFIPVIAQIWVIPIQIYYFNNISIYSVFANIMSVPILSIISFGGFVSSLLSLITPISHFVCQIFDTVLNPLITILMNISDFWGNLPNSNMQTTHPNVGQLILYYLIILNIIAFFSDLREKYSKILIISCPVLLSILLLSTISIPNHNLEITAFDVGNADAFMIKTPDNKYIMIDTAKGGYDGGKSQAEIIILKYFKDIGIKKLDSIIVTHFDNDHCGGAVDLMKNLKVNNIYLNSLNHQSKSANEIYSTAKKYNVKITEAENNQIVLKESGLEIKNFIANDVSGIGDNESSIITLLKFNKFSMLFTGDAGVETLNKLKKNLPQNITVLKVGHHGAFGVINKEMANYLNPEYSIISTGENKFGHPSIYTVKTLNKSNILRTDNNNSLRVVVNSNKYKVLAYNAERKKYERIK